MKINSPCIITSRLLPGINIGGAEISIGYAKRDGRDGRTRYQYYIGWDGKTHESDDLQSGCQGSSLQEGLVSLLSFLGAFAEASRPGGSPESENADLFPSWLAGWAYLNSDEIVAAEYDLQECVAIDENWGEDE